MIIASTTILIACYIPKISVVFFFLGPKVKTRLGFQQSRQKKMLIYSGSSKKITSKIIEKLYTRVVQGADHE